MFGEIIGAAFQWAGVGLILWGIYWSFHRHGPGHGVAAVFLPPYAAYRGVASIWEKPAWKEEWDENTEALGYVVAGSGNQLDTKQATDLVKAKTDVRKWLREVPSRERTELRHATENYVNAIAQQGRNFMNDLVDGGVMRPSSDPSVAVFVQRFQNVKGLMAAWNRMQTETTTFLAQSQREAQGLSPHDQQELFRRKALGLQAMEGSVGLMTATVDELFGK